MRKVKTGGGWPALMYTLRKGREAGGIWKLWKAMRSKNACKTCALGMGGQRGGMVNEAGHFPEVCKKSLQAMVADMQGAIRHDFFHTYSIPQLQAFSPRELEANGRLTQPLLLSRGEQFYRPISWDDALGRIVDKLKSVAPAETFWYFSGRSSNEAGFLLQLQLRRTMVPVRDLLRQTVLHSGPGLLHPGSPASPNFLDVTGDNFGDRVRLCPLLDCGGDPCALRPRQQLRSRWFICLERPVVQVRGVMKMVGFSRRIKLDVEHSPRDGATLTARQ